LRHLIDRNLAIAAEASLAAQVAQADRDVARLQHALAAEATPAAALPAILEIRRHFRIDADGAVVEHLVNGRVAVLADHSDLPHVDLAHIRRLAEGGNPLLKLPSVEVALAEATASAKTAAHVIPGPAGDNRDGRSMGVGWKVGVAHRSDPVARTVAATCDNPERRVLEEFVMRRRPRRGIAWKLDNTHPGKVSQTLLQ
jgi:hypothetical protein